MPAPHAGPARVGQVTVSASHWVGPLPSPEALREFDRIVPNGAARIMAMAESEQSHRISMEQSGQNAAISETRRTQYLGATISLVAIVGAIGVALYTKDWIVPCALLSLPVMSVVRALLQSRSRVQKPPAPGPKSG